MVWLPINIHKSHRFSNKSVEMGVEKAEHFQWENLLGDTSIYALFFFLFVISICANFQVIYVVLARVSGARRQVAVYLLVLHLSLIVLGILGLTLSKAVDILINFQGPILCRVMGFFKGSLSGAFSTNMMAIVYERVVSPLNSYRNHLMASRLIVIVWILPIFQGILDVFTSTSIEEEMGQINYPSLLGNCVLVPTFGSETTFIINECFRFFTFHLVVTLYMAFAIFKLWLSLDTLYQLSPTHGDIFQKKLQSIRYILIHLGTFIIFWIPIGFFTFTRRLVSCGISLFENPEKDWLYNSINDETSSLNRSIGLSTLLYLTLNPIINLLLLDPIKVNVCPCNVDGFTVTTTSTPPLYQSESEEFYRMGNLTKKKGDSAVNATGRLSSHERESSKHSSDVESCGAKLVRTQVMVHQVDRQEMENAVKAEVIGESNKVGKGESYSVEDII